MADVFEAEGWVRDYMSRPLHEAMLVLDPLIMQHGDYLVSYSELIRQLGYTQAKEIPEVRRLLQRLGTEVGRNMFDQGVWVNWMEDRIAQTRDNIVITGIRYPNEARMIRCLNGQIWWVMRPGYGPVNSHSSDNSLDYTACDRVIMNDGTLEDLANQVLDQVR